MVADLKWANAGSSMTRSKHCSVNRPTCLASAKQNLPKTGNAPASGDADRATAKSVESKLPKVVGPRVIAGPGVIAPKVPMNPIKPSTETSVPTVSVPLPAAAGATVQVRPEMPLLQPRGMQLKLARGAVPTMPISGTGPSASSSATTPATASATTATSPAAVVPRAAGMAVPPRMPTAPVQPVRGPQPPKAPPPALEAESAVNDGSQGSWSRTAKQPLGAVMPAGLNGKSKLDARVSGTTASKNAPPEPPYQQPVHKPTHQPPPPPLPPIPPPPRDVEVVDRRPFGRRPLREGECFRMLQGLITMRAQTRFRLGKVVDLLPLAMDASLRKILESLDLTCFRAALGELGLSSPEDVTFLLDQDLRQVGLNLVQVRKLQSRARQWVQEDVAQQAAVATDAPCRSTDRKRGCESANEDERIVKPRLSEPARPFGMCGRNFPRRLIFIRRVSLPVRAAFQNGDFRHGESEANVNRKITATVPDHDLHLTERGRQQAAEAGQRLASLVGEGSVRFTYSPYTRARETLNGILRAGALEKWPCQEDVRIREQEFGNYDSPEIKEFHKEKASFGPFYYRFRDGESPADCWDRASSYLESLRQSFADETAENHVIVGHGTMLMVMLMRFFQLPVGDFDFYKSLQNCEFVVCERKKAGLAMAAAAFRDAGVRWVCAGWTVFTVENLVMSEYKVEIKKYWGGSGGPGAYQTMYSTLSGLASFSIFAAYWRFARHGLALRSPSSSERLLALGFRVLGLGTLSQLMPPINLGALQIALGLYEPPKDLPPQVRGAMACPFDFNAHAGRGEVFGITRLSRRPELAGIGFVGIGGALVATTATQMAFWGFGPVVSFSILALHSDRVQRRSGELSTCKEEQTSLVPFLALLDGRQSWATFYNELVMQNLFAAALLAIFYSAGGCHLDNQVTGPARRDKDDPKFELSYTWPPGEDKNYAGLRFKTEELPQKEIWDGNLDSCMLSHEPEAPKE
eukprot:s4455_g5.t4